MHGGHHLAPQYSSTGFFSPRAWVKARSMSASPEASCHDTEAEALAAMAVGISAGSAPIVDNAAARAVRRAAERRRRAIEVGKVMAGIAAS